MTDQTGKPRKTATSGVSSLKRPVFGVLLLSVMIAPLGIGIFVPVMPVFAVSLGRADWRLV